MKRLAALCAVLILSSSLSAQPPIPTSGVQGRARMARRARVSRVPVALRIQGAPFVEVRASSADKSDSVTAAVSTTGAAHLQLIPGRRYHLYSGQESEPFYELQVPPARVPMPEVTIPSPPAVYEREGSKSMWDGGTLDEISPRERIPTGAARPAPPPAPAPALPPGGQPPIPTSGGQGRNEPIAPR